MPRITFFESDRSVTVPDGTLLIDALRGASVTLDASCGGKGRCKKCQVTIMNPSPDQAGSPRSVLACQYQVRQDLIVRIPNVKEHAILQTGSGRIRTIDPVIRSIHAEIPRCPIGESTSECARIRQILGADTKIPLSLTRTLYQKLEQLDYKGTFLLFDEELLDIRPDGEPFYTLAFDIGTTTIVSYLLDGRTGEEKAVSSILNPQSSYGADVISRCEYALTDPDQTLTMLVRSALNDLIQKNAQKAGISPEQIYFVSVAGNTSMHHLFLGISPASLLHAPYNATEDEMQFLSAREVGLNVHPGAKICVLPVIAGFVGADTTAVLLSLPEHTFDQLTLILDIGTNGELVLGRGDERFTCSTAAGPAFEGAKITCGMRGAYGAVDHVRLDKDRLELSVIGNTKPVGICGSGLIDLIYCLLKLGILSGKGRMEKPARWKPEAAARYEKRLVRKDGILAFLLTDDPDGIYLTQKDVREVQLAKAALAAGIELLCERMNVSAGQIQSVLLAGAFGSYLSAESACGIGIIPAELSDRIHVIGNAAGEGAKAAASDRKALRFSAELARSVSFIELATSAKFQDTYFGKLDF